MDRQNQEYSSSVLLYIVNVQNGINMKYEVASKDKSDIIAVEDDSDKKMESDCDIYIFRYWDNFKVSEAQEAIDYIEGKLKQNFRKNRVKDSDQLYK